MNRFAVNHTIHNDILHITMLAIDITRAQNLSMNPTLTYAARKLSWSSVNAATNYELWINYLGTPSQGKIIYQPRYVGTSYMLPSTLPTGRYQTWLRAIQAENGELYVGAWTSVTFDFA